MVSTNPNGERCCWSCDRYVDTGDCVKGYVCPVCGEFTKRPEGVEAV